MLDATPTLAPGALAPRSRTRTAGITGFGRALPETVVENAPIAARIGVEPEWITKRTGISARRRAVEGEGLSDIAIAAGQRALAAAGLDPAYVDAVLVATSSADDIVPQAAPIVAGALGADRAMAWDVGLACTGFLAGLQQGAALIESGRANTVLLIGADVLSRYTDHDDRKTAALFGDGAAAAVLAPGGPASIGPIVLGANSQRDLARRGRRAPAPARPRPADRIRRRFLLGRRTTDLRRNTMSTTTTNGHQPEVASATREGCRPDDAVMLVTGASTGIGAAIARELAADGWAVAAGYRSDAAGAAATVAAIEQDGGSAIAIGGDVCDADAMQRVIEEAEERLGPVLGLVNNAGVRADGLAIGLDDDQWDRVLDTNLSAAFRLTRSVLRPMIKARYGRIVNVASVVGPRANAGQCNYAAAKAGLIGMTKTIGVEIARRGVTVNAVAPGFIDTEMTADLPPELLEAVPARRPGRPDEVAAAVRFLASDAASYVTATTLFVDGGMSA